MTVKTLEKLMKIEQELQKIKKGQGFYLPKTPLSLKGILKGVDITEKDIEKAKRSLLRQFIS